MEQINLNSISKQKLLNFFQIFCDKANIKFICNSDKDSFCWADVKNKEISLNITWTKHRLAFAFFHELGHFEVFKRNLFNIARDVCEKKDFDLLSDHDQRIYLITALKLEQWCDTFGEKESLKYFKNPMCYKPYHTEHGKNWFRENFYY